jgi:hypothetical protein
VEVSIRTLGGEAWKLGYTCQMPQVGDTMRFVDAEPFGMKSVRVIEVIHTVDATDFAQQPPRIIVAPIDPETCGTAEPDSGHD